MKSFIILCLSFIIISCQHQQSKENSSLGKYYPSEAGQADEEYMEMDPARTEEPNPSEYSLEKGSKMIKSGNMNFEVNQLENTKRKIDSLIRSVDAYYENEQYHAYGNRIAYSLQIRIPITKFDTIIEVLERGVGVLTSKNIRAQDVTEEYVDLNIRLDNNLQYLLQYQSILKRAKSIKEVLDVQEKIRRIEEEIDSKKGRLKYLDNQVNYSTLHLEISELISGDIANKPKFGRRVINAFNNGIQVFLSFIIALINFWPFLLLIGFLYFIRKPVLQRIKRRKLP